jgi:hypothetical protein
MVLMTFFWAGLRVGEVSQLCFGDVFHSERRRCAELVFTRRLINKGRHARTVFVVQKLRDERARYGKSDPPSAPKNCSLRLISAHGGASRLIPMSSIL